MTDSSSNLLPDDSLYKPNKCTPKSSIISSHTHHNQSSMASITAFLALTLAFAMLLLTASDASRLSFKKLENEGGGQPECWTALSNIRSCSNEIIGFLLNGQADIDKPCCVAIATIAEFCWPALVGTLGYSPEAVSFLEDYCEKTGSDTNNVTTNASP